MLSLEWRCKHFNLLTNEELYALLRLRSEVFVVQQNCVFLDMDNKDQFCHHLLGYISNELVVSARLLPPNTTFKEISIGRVVGSPKYRGLGAGKALMQEAITQCYELFGNGDIQIGAQMYLQQFYESFGFKQHGEMYYEDAIPHIHMILQKP